ncbi:Lethal(2) giant larvae protein 1 [Datura stramonium]|uniref:Lethal(2) giant larvae protein 1 n=1 Tax=Datura stramonium TaxID=4076 RepID=A0ABS8W1V5_DATST|nr:Lethal(2) giant larvae protein 1 [Datura stramonium]
MVLSDSTCAAFPVQEIINITPMHSFPSISARYNNAAQGSEKLTDLEATVAVHYGIPSTASILAFDPIQQLLAIGTLDGRIKLIGGSNVEGLLLSPKPLPFKNLEFLQNQGFLVGVSNGNEIQVWDLETRRISSSLQWESNITAFSVIYDTHYMFVGDEYGYFSVLKYEGREGSMEVLPYHIPPNLIADAVEISMPDQLAIVGLLPQPSSHGNRVLIAYENGLIILWDITEDRAILVREYKQLQSKGETVVYASKKATEGKFCASSDNQDGEKEISSLCWLSSDGSILAVGYVDGDILLWNLSVPGKRSSEAEALPSYVKLQLSGGDRRLPVIILHWSANNAQNDCGGKLFVYGGDSIGSEEALTVLNLDWSSGIEALKCVGRVDLGLDGSFADAIVVSNANEAGIDDASSLFVLSNPGQLHFYDKTSLSALKFNPEKKHAEFAVKYSTVVPTLEPCITVANLYPVDRKWNSSRTPSEEVMNVQLRPAHGVTELEIKMPLSSSIPRQLPLTEDDGIERILVAGYLDGSVRLWNATFPVFKLIAVLESQGIQDTGPRTAISALDFSSTALTLAIGHQCGQVHVYSLKGQSKTTSLNLATDAEQDVQFCPSDTGFQFSLIKSPVCILKFVAAGTRLVAGFESGQVSMLDVSSSSVLFITDCLSSSSSGITYVAVKTLDDAREDTVEHCEEGTTNAYVKEVISVLTRDAEVVLLDGSTGKRISSQAEHPKEMSTAISLHILDGITSVFEESQKHSLMLDSAVQPEDLTQKCMDSQILLSCQDGLHLFSLTSIIQGDINPVHEVKLTKPCSWTSILKNDAENYLLVLVYQSGAVEIRSLPDLDVLGESSLMSILRWNSKINMDKTISSPGKATISLVNGSEFAVFSLLAFGNAFRVPESLPSLHKKSVTAAVDDNVTTSIFGGIMKGLKGFKGQQAADYINARDALVTHLENIFSRFPFSEPTNVMDDLDSLELKLDDIEIDEPVHVTSLSLSGDDVRIEKETNRDRLLEGGSSDAKPKLRSREEIIAKYRYNGDAAAAAADAKDKLLERQEKLERLSKNTEELQSGAENFADLAGELVKAMEKRKWWNL